MIRPLLLAPAVFACALIAAAEPQTITVRGKGKIDARPDTLTVTLHASGKAEKAADAAEKLEKKLAELKEAVSAVLQGHKQQAATMKDTGMTFGSGANQAQIMVLNGLGNQTELAAENNASTELIVTVPGADKIDGNELGRLITALLDKGTEAGATVCDATGCTTVWFTGMQGVSSAVSFTFSDVEAAREKAWEKAVAAAKKRAEVIAGKLGLSVGGAVKVRDLTADDVEKQTAATAWTVALQAGVSGSVTATKSSGDVTLEAELEVEFELKTK
jgi:uncharacterized protein YggE